ncbi:MAG: hypothetical protein AMS27_09265 [Bacteroides sp. SM23_62_1]|nr:MAG: hypothetical protein AMS27_09265 [Bacteroides sp. SM23_62_1]
MVVNFKSNEQVVKAGDSTYFSENEKISGKLIITNQRIYFISVNGHTKEVEFEILPSEILEVIYFNQSIFSQNGLNVVMKNGDQLKFTVKKRNEMGALINKMY